MSDRIRMHARTDRRRRTKSAIGRLSPLVMMLIGIGCGDVEPAEQLGSSKASMTGADDGGASTSSSAGNFSPRARHAVAVQVLDKSDAAAALRTGASVMLQAGRDVFTVRAKGGTLRPLNDGERCGDAVLGFVGEYGTLLMSGNPAPGMGSLDLAVLLPHSTYQRGEKTSEIIMFRQEIDGFAVDDNLVSGRCIGKNLVDVWGRLFDPNEAPTKHASLAVATEAAARSLFEAQVGAAAAEPSVPVEPFLRMKQGQAVWRFGQYQIDAITGAAVDPMPLPHVDPAETTGGAP